ncbi:hypothetical protein DFH09DRAFT_1124345 [Mycena vulgaris]|nr:hypothetical protein DFH09DRAFT_1124345 [Mycena vulgaris]
MLSARSTTARPTCGCARWYSRRQLSRVLGTVTANSARNLDVRPVFGEGSHARWVFIFVSLSLLGSQFSASPYPVPCSMSIYSSLIPFPLVCLLLRLNTILRLQRRQRQIRPRRRNGTYPPSSTQRAIPAPWMKRRAS